ncbi:Integrator complex subunit 9 [Actinomortierella ambigua]|uniref:Integrator complex subunit 9 n=1 Tax=Actinomortierella ambigua TaxID=1343610 RepID=A0A9P6PXJ0_9FUNG|nr:Integrator complex subunit 9 [Actinomortierella ambigua]
MRLTSLSPEGEPTCLVLKIRQMLILLDCGLGIEQFYPQPVRKGGLTSLNDPTLEPSSKKRDASVLETQGGPGTTVKGSSSAAPPTKTPRLDRSHQQQQQPQQQQDLRSCWASFLHASAAQRLDTKSKRAAHHPHQPLQETGTATSKPLDIENSSATASNSEEYLFKPPDFTGIDLKAIDVVLISNYHHILALPYLTEYTEFQGRIFATEPTIEFGRQLMTEFVSYFGANVTSTPRDTVPQTSKLVRPKNGLYPAYTFADIKACIDKIQPVRFRENISLYGSLRLTAHSAGYCLGSSNWLIRIGAESLAYISSSSVQVNLHPDLFDGSLLEKAKTVIAADICPPQGSITYDRGINEVCSNIARTIAQKGNVLIPCTITGFVFDMIEDVHLHLGRMGLDHQFQYSFVSPVADTALQYSNILAEWMAPRKQEMVYLPEAPMLHAKLLEQGTANNYKSVHGAFSADLKHPCIVFGGDPTLRSGAMVNLLHMWGNKPNNTIVIIDPRVDQVAALEPYEGLTLSKCICPLDIRLSIDQLVDILRKYKAPRWVLVPSSAAHETDTTQDGSGVVELRDKRRTTSTAMRRWTVYKNGEAVQRGLGELYEAALLSEELARGIFPQSFGGTSFAPVSGSLSIYNNQMQLEPVTGTGRQILALSSKKQLCGSMNLHNLLAGLALLGIEDPVIKECSYGKDNLPEIKVEFELEGQPGTIILRDKETIVRCDEAIRPLLREPILKCFQTL